MLPKVWAFQHEQDIANVPPVRTTRSRIIYLRNDYKALMNVIEKHIHEHFASLAANGVPDEPMTDVVSQNTETPALRPPPSQAAGPPFAKVNSVIEGSPAESAGLKAGDEIRNFGYVNSTNHDGLRRVGECVQGNEGVSSPQSSWL
jgi:26S proteasome non-ATPase regulatory subunit 9